MLRNCLNSTLWVFVLAEKFHPLIVHSFDKYLLSTYYVQEIGEIAMNKMTKSWSSRNYYSSGERQTVNKNTYA